MNIQQATIENLPAINQLIHSSTAYQGDYSAILRDVALTVDYINENRVYIIEGETSVIGFYSFIELPNFAELDFFFVSDQRQRSGVGNRLFQHLVSTLKSHHIQRLKIVSHPPALGFYLSMGAKVVGELIGRGPITWNRPMLELKI